MSLKLAFASALLTFGLASPAFAHPHFGGGPQFAPMPAAYHGPARGGWDEIGSTQASFRGERDVIFAHGRDRYSEIKVCVYRQAVRLFDLDVTFARGGHQDLAVRHVIGAGDCTRAIDLKGKRRDIKAVAFAYKTLAGPRWGRHVQPAIVKVFAR
jgi:hypothetical protein